METLIVQPKNHKQLAAVEAVLKALNVAFKKEEKSPYNPAFVAKIKRGEQAAKNGKGVKINISDLWK